VRGQLDLAVHYEDPSADNLVVERLGDLGASLYCGRGHPLWSVRAPTRPTVLAHAFSVPQVGDTGHVLDGWPVEWPRKVGMRITTLRSNLEVCRSGALLTVLPDVTAAAEVAAGALRRVPFRALPRIPVFAARHPSSDREAVRAAVQAVRARLHAANVSARSSARSRRAGGHPARAARG
jgi:DNA-binding transcriptional LysR family regulator